MATIESGTIAVLAEKPSVARDIATVLVAERQCAVWRFQPEGRQPCIA